MSEEEAAEEEEAVPRRDPSEKQEPHTVMWGKSLKYPGWNFHYKSSGLGSYVKKSMVFTVPLGPCVLAFCSNPRSHMFLDSNMGWS